MMTTGHVDADGHPLDDPAYAVRCRAELDWINTQYEVLHDRVADHSHLHHVSGLDLRQCRHLCHQLADRFADGSNQVGFATRIHHDVRHTAHQIFAKSNLWIHFARTSENVTAGQVAKMRSNCC